MRGSAKHILHYGSFMQTATFELPVLPASSYFIRPLTKNTLPMDKNKRYELCGTTVQARSITLQARRGALQGCKASVQPTS